MKRKNLKIMVYVWTAIVLALFIVVLIYPSQGTVAALLVGLFTSIFPIATLAKYRNKNLYPETEEIDYSKAMEEDFKEETENSVSSREEDTRREE